MVVRSARWGEGATVSKIVEAAKTLIHLVVVLAFGISFTIFMDKCGSGDLVPLSTATPTVSRAPTARPPTITAEPAQCIPWSAASQYRGTYQCICGEVTHTHADDSGAFFIDFTDDRSAFYLVSFSCMWDDLQGDCVRACGDIVSYKGRPQMVIGCELGACP